MLIKGSSSFLRTPVGPNVALAVSDKQHRLESIRVLRYADILCPTKIHVASSPKMLSLSLRIDELTRVFWQHEQESYQLFKQICCVWQVDQRRDYQFKESLITIHIQNAMRFDSCCDLFALAKPDFIRGEFFRVSHDNGHSRFLRMGLGRVSILIC